MAKEELLEKLDLAKVPNVNSLKDGDYVISVVDGQVNKVNVRNLNKAVTYRNPFFNGYVYKIGTRFERDFNITVCCASGGYVAKTDILILHHSNFSPNLIQKKFISTSIYRDYDIHIGMIGENIYLFTSNKLYNTSSSITVLACAGVDLLNNLQKIDRTSIDMEELKKNSTLNKEDTDFFSFFDKQ